MKPTYRADIDGLRAIAVLSVLFFHFDIAAFSGGYVGVDIFFIISGYLITTIIFSEISANNFSLLRFYERRFRRILPALTVVVLAAIGVGLLLLPPDRFEALASSAVATMIFSSNFLFYHESGYFDIASELKPLLHTWSLGIEEQYYILFPLLLLFVARRGGSIKLWVGVVFLASLIYAAYITPINTSQSFFLLPSRAWELMLGSMVALNVLPNLKADWLREFLASSGLVLVAASIFLFDDNTLFPGLMALVPALGAALIIYSGVHGRTLTARLLSLRPLVFVGLISYSLYLWHWLVHVYAKIYLAGSPGWMVTLWLIALVFVLAVLSWRFIERPFRKGGLLKSRRSVFITSLSASLFIIITSVTLSLNKYIFEQAAAPELSQANEGEWRSWGECKEIEGSIRRGDGPWEIGTQGDAAEFVLWGDSHSCSLASGIHISAKKYGVAGLVAAMPACPPLLGVEREGRQSCEQFNRLVLDELKNRPSIKTVILAARWALSTKGTRYRQEGGDDVRLVELGTKLAMSNAEMVERGLVRTIMQLEEMGLKVILIGPVPEIGADVPSYKYAADISGRDVNQLISPTIIEYDGRVSEVKEIFAKLESRPAVSTIYVDMVFCKQGLCRVEYDNKALYRDGDHLSFYGSKILAPLYDSVFEELSGR